jgi:hypothetical protein
MPARNVMRDKIIRDTLAADPAAIFYKSTSPCRAKGHVGLRYISNHGCVTCAEQQRQEIKAALATVRAGGSAMLPRGG